MERDVQSVGLELGPVTLRVGDGIAHDDVDEPAVLLEDQRLGLRPGRADAERSTLPPGWPIEVAMSTAAARPAASGIPISHRRRRDGACW